MTDSPVREPRERSQHPTKPFSRSHETPRISVARAHRARARRRARTRAGFSSLDARVRDHAPPPPPRPRPASSLFVARRADDGAASRRPPRRWVVVPGVRRAGAGARDAVLRGADRRRRRRAPPAGLHGGGCVRHLPEARGRRDRPRALRRARAERVRAPRRGPSRIRRGPLLARVRHARLHDAVPPPRAGVLHSRLRQRHARERVRPLHRHRDQPRVLQHDHVQRGQRVDARRAVRLRRPRARLHLPRGRGRRPAPLGLPGQHQDVPDPRPRPVRHLGRPPRDRRPLLSRGSVVHFRGG